MRIVLFFIFLCVCTLQNTASFGQCQTYRLTSNGDTLNCEDMKGKKQGKWVIHVGQLRGEPGYEEEGEFKDNNREGRWRKYTLNGELTAIENYRWGKKDGVQQYLLEGMIEHEESWRAIDPEKKFDTIDVPDLYDQYKVDRKVIKVESYSMKHGIWKFYRPGTQSIIKTETYVYDKLQVPKTETKSTTENNKEGNPPKKVLPAAIKDFEKKNAGKVIKGGDGTFKY